VILLTTFKIGIPLISKNVINVIYWHTKIQKTNYKTVTKDV